MKKKIKTTLVGDAVNWEFRTEVNFTYEEISRISGPKLCLMAHYNSECRIHDYVIFYIKSLKELGFEIILCSTSMISNQSKEKISTLVSGILIQENYGWDFGLWKSALMRLKNEILDRLNIKSLILTNDSVYGPIRSLDEIFRDMENENVDLWGMSESLEIQKHIQSYFLNFGERIIQSDFFWNFWTNMKYFSDKRLVISNYELKIERLFFERGFRCKAFFSEEKLRRAVDSNHKYRNKKIEEINPTLALGEEILYNYNFPFIKGELLRKKMLSKKAVINLENYISNLSYPTSLIREHLNSKR
ncbi:rhamnan synthesis F family protein [Leptospira sp. FAT2]|uniref:rhamnan synthesis F family protein n=1 Tax=Leptospira sanjuanensis TaxID=2879643 RepID=UPI001EE82EFC|nr:rhamnan synthesis F family protein [Leptospira sanjuanensis]MCG6167629.1 rhamnan synthesis F family protein [Leptospira sanjuanensis]MCG6193045.1 rhamnan synthesis F family protein [Leptospira sanjuanensis]